MSIKEKVIEGYTFSLLHHIIYLLALFVARIFIYRLLTSVEMGLYNICVAILGISGVFSGFGLIEATIQLKESDENEVITTGFVLIILFASILFLLIIISGNKLSQAFNDPLIATILPYLLLFSLIDIFGYPPRLFARRKLSFKPIYISGIIKDLIGIICSLFLAFLGFGVWSLVFGICISFFFHFCLSWTYISYSTRLKVKENFTFSRISFRLTKRLLKFSIPLLIGTIILAFLQNSISLIFGFLINVEAVGYYAAAFFFIGPFEVIARSLAGVTFSTFSRLQSHQDSIRRGIQQFLRYSAFFFIPPSIILLILGDKLILFLLGAKWMPASNILVILAIIPLIIPFGNLGQSVLKSIGDTITIIKANSCRVAVFIGTALILTPQIGLMGVALAITFQYGVQLYYPLALNKRFNFVHEIFENYKTPLLSLPIIGIILFFLRQFIISLFILGLVIAFSFGLFFVLLYALEGPRLIKDLKDLFKQIKGGL